MGVDALAMARFPHRTIELRHSATEPVGFSRPAHGPRHVLLGTCRSIHALRPAINWKARMAQDRKCRTRLRGAVIAGRSQDRMSPRGCGMIFRG